MPHRHLIRLLDEHRAQWLAQDRAGRVLAGPLDGFPTQAAQETVVLVPSSAVLLLQAPRVARQQRQLERAVAYAIEDQLVAPVEQAHVAVLEDVGPDAVAVAVVARAQLETWLARLAEHGVVADRLLPEGCLLPFDPQPTLLLEGDAASLRHARTGLLAGTREESAGWLELLRAQGDERSLAIVSERAQADLPAWAADARRTVVEVPSWLAARAADLPATGHNLLTGPYRSRRRAAATPMWLVAAGLTIAGVLVAMAAMTLERWQLDRTYMQQRAQMETLLRETVPGVQRVVDPRAQMLGELARQRGQGSSAGVLAMLARIAPLLAGSGRYVPESLEYRSGTLDFTLRGADVETLDQLRGQIAALGYAVELVSMVPGSGGVEGKLRIRGGGA